jgi:hypothetical protein
MVAKKTPAKKTPAKKTPAKKTPAKKAVKAPAKKTPVARKAPAPAKKAAPPKKAPAAPKKVAPASVAKKLRRIGGDVMRTIYDADLRIQHRQHSTNGMLSPVNYEHTSATHRTTEQSMDEHHGRTAA